MSDSVTEKCLLWADSTDEKGETYAVEVQRLVVPTVNRRQEWENVHSILSNLSP
jgi:hypothetical protein